jgi:hypothetical protein
MTWPDDWRGTLALVLGGGAMVCLVILSVGLVIAAITSHDMENPAVAMTCGVLGVGLGVAVTYLATRPPKAKSSPDNPWPEPRLDE